MGNTATVQVTIYWSAPSNLPVFTDWFTSCVCDLVSFPIGYDDLAQGTTAADYSKGGYSGSAQAQSKSAGTGPGKGNFVSAGH